MRKEEGKTTVWGVGAAGKELWASRGGEGTGLRWGVGELPIKKRLLSIRRW